MLVWRSVSRPPPRDGEVRVRTSFAAVNRADVDLDGPGLRAAIGEMAALVREGRLRAPAIERFAMADAAAAHRAMERGELRGRALLVP